MPGSQTIDTRRRRVFRDSLDPRGRQNQLAPPISLREIELAKAHEIAGRHPEHRGTMLRKLRLVDVVGRVAREILHADALGDAAPERLVHGQACPPLEYRGERVVVPVAVSPDRARHVFVAAEPLVHVGLHAGRRRGQMIDSRDAPDEVQHLGLALLRRQQTGLVVDAEIGERRVEIDLPRAGAQVLADHGAQQRLSRRVDIVALGEIAHRADHDAVRHDHERSGRARFRVVEHPLQRGPFQRSAAARSLGDCAEAPALACALMRAIAATLNPRCSNNLMSIAQLTALVPQLTQERKNFRRLERRPAVTTLSAATRRRSRGMEIPYCGL